MLLETLETWPIHLTEFLGSQCELLIADAMFEKESHHRYCNPIGRHVPQALMPPNPHFWQRQQAAEKVTALLQGEVLRGWHCTRLTDDEVTDIQKNGMRLPNPQLLQKRISRLESDGVISSRIAERLWFCFFRPSLAGQYGIERFFRHWGGEALYNSHEEDPETGAALKKIGCPRLIEVDVPISTLGYLTALGDNVIRQFLVHRKLVDDDPVEFADQSRIPISAANIIRFVQHGHSEFAELTGCDEWSPPL